MSRLGVQVPPPAQKITPTKAWRDGLRKGTGQAPTRSTGLDCKSSVFRLRRFESSPVHEIIQKVIQKVVQEVVQKVVRNVRNVSGT